MKNPFKNIYKTPTVLYPKSIEQDIYCGNLLGYAHPNSSVYNIISTDEFLNSPIKNLAVIGKIINVDENGKFFNYILSLDESISNKQLINYVEKPPIEFGQIIALRKKNKVQFFTSSELLCKSESYTLINDIFSRNTGILETDLMLNKTVIISGCGSVGSLIALELAKAGVGKFLLIDNDILSYHNLCRHQCGIADVGKYKVDAVEEKILQFNPTAQIKKSISIIEDVSENLFTECCNQDTIIIGCADNREGDVYANLISKIYKSAFIAIGLWERAFAGEVFYTLPNGSPCYKCFYDDIGEVITKPSGYRRFYFEEENAEKLKFEPGISIDINFVTIIAAKLAIDILNINTPNYVPKIIDYVSQFTLICNTNATEVGGEKASFFSYPLQVSKRDVKYCNQCEENKSCVLMNF